MHTFELEYHSRTIVVWTSKRQNVDIIGHNFLVEHVMELIFGPFWIWERDADPLAILAYNSVQWIMHLVHQLCHKNEDNNDLLLFNSLKKYPVALQAATTRTRTWICSFSQFFRRKIMIWREDVRSEMSGWIFCFFVRRNSTDNRVPPGSFSVLLAPPCCSYLSS